MANCLLISKADKAIEANTSAIASNTTAIATKQDKILTFTNKTVATSAWSSNSTVSGYGYRASIALSGVTANHLVTVIPNQATNDLGILSVEVDSYNGGVYIYAKSVPSTTLLFNVIKAERGGETIVVNPNPEILLTQDLSYSDSSNVTKSFSKSFDFSKSIVVKKITGAITVGHSGASASSTQTITIKLGNSTVYTSSKTRGANGSCTYDIDIDVTDSNTYSALTVSYSATDNEKEKNISLTVIGKII